MNFEANANADVTVLKQTLTVDAHVAVALPNNPVTVYRCLSNSHDDCSVMDHVEVVAAEFDTHLE